MEQALAFFIIFLFFGGLIALTIWVVRSSIRKTWLHTGLLADQLGLPLPRRNEKHGMNDFPVIQAMYRNRQINIYSHVVGSGKNRTRVTTLLVSCKTHPANTLSLSKEGLFSKIGIALGMQDIKTGNIDFDEKYVLKSHSDIFARSIFDYQTCLLAIQAYEFFSYAGLQLKNGRFEYTESGTISNDKTRNRFHNMIVFADLLCQRVEGGPGGTQSTQGMRAQ